MLFALCTKNAVPNSKWTKIKVWKQTKAVLANFYTNSRESGISKIEHNYCLNLEERYAGSVQPSTDVLPPTASPILIHETPRGRTKTKTPEGGLVRSRVTYLTSTPLCHKESLLWGLWGSAERRDSSSKEPF